MEINFKLKLVWVMSKTFEISESGDTNWFRPTFSIMLSGFFWDFKKLNGVLFYFEKNK